MISNVEELFEASDRALLDLPIPKPWIELLAVSRAGRPTGLCLTAGDNAGHPCSPRSV
jgi:hypothetical protein